MELEQKDNTPIESSSTLAQESTSVQYSAASFNTFGLDSTLETSAIISTSSVLSSINQESDIIQPHIDNNTTLRYLSIDITETLQLSQFQLAINIPKQFLLCTWCHVIVGSQGVSQHIKDKHQRIISRTDMQFLYRHIRQLEISHQIKLNIPKPPQRDEHTIPWGGLTVYDGFKCHYCHFVSPSVIYLRKHHQKDHSTWQTSNIPKSFIPCKMQCTSSKMWFRVFVDEEQDSRVSAAIRSSTVNEDDQLQSILDFMSTDLLVHEATEARDITPWLHATKWHLHMASYSISELQSLVQYPKQETILLEAVESYFNDAVALLDSTNTLILQKLNTNDIQKT